MLACKVAAGSPRTYSRVLFQQGKFVSVGPPGFGAPIPAAYTRAPLPYPNLGPGPGTNYPPVESRGNLFNLKVLIFAN